MEISWILLVIAGLMEPCWVYTMERSDRFRRPGMALLTVALIAIDLYILSVAMGPIGSGTAYAVWAGIGAVCTFVMGAVVYRERVSSARVMCIVSILIGIVGLHLISGGH